MRFKHLLTNTETQTSEYSQRQIAHKLFLWAHEMYPKLFPRKSKYDKSVRQDAVSAMLVALGYIKHQRTHSKMTSEAVLTGSFKLLTTELKRAKLI